MRQAGPYFEKVAWEQGSSISLLNRRLKEAIPFQWHHHPEYELTLTLNSRGQRFIGDHVGGYGDGDLVLVGPNLPHTWFSREKVEASKPHVAMVVWFRPEWAASLTQNCSEFSGVRRLFERAAGGLQFSRNPASVRERFRQLFACEGAERLLHFLAILHELSSAKSERLASHSPASVKQPESRERIDRVLNHIHRAYAQSIRLEDLAEIAALSQSAVHRLFLKHTSKTIGDYLMHLRIGDACARLGSSDEPVAFIAEAVGYQSLANFNRQFRALKGMTPREYRNLLSSPTSGR